MGIILLEIYRFLFILSIIFVLYILGDLGLKSYSRFMLENETKFVLTDKSKMLLWFSFGLIITFLTKSFTI